MKPTNTTDKKLVALLQRQADIKAALKTVRERRKAVADRDRERLVHMIGHAVLDYTARHPEFRATLRAVLAEVTTEGTSAFNTLKSEGLV